MAISYLPEEEEDAQSTADWIRECGAQALLLPGDARDEGFAAEIVERTVQELGGLNVVVLNAAYQKNREGLETIPTEEFDRVFKTNLYSLIWTAQAAIPHLRPGASIIVTASIQAFNPSAQLIDYAMTKAARWPSPRPWPRNSGPRGSALMQWRLALSGLH